MALRAETWVKTELVQIMHKLVRTAMCAGVEIPSTSYRAEIAGCSFMGGVG